MDLLRGPMDTVRALKSPSQIHMDSLRIQRSLLRIQRSLLCIHRSLNYFQKGAFRIHGALDCFLWGLNCF